jgi:predicted regulator of Ras-like GTPase activity (Roadblock/LC7/MglB family)
MQIMQRIDEESQRTVETQSSAESSDILKELADRVPGFVAGYITNMEGETVFAESPADHATFELDAAPEALFEVLTVVNRVLETVEAGQLQEVITLTGKYRFITRYMEKDGICLQLVLTADGNLGAARMYLTAYELQDEV